MELNNNGGGVNNDSHLQNGNLGEIFLLKVGVRDELQLCLEETVERLEEKNQESAEASSLFKKLTCLGP